MSRRCYQITTVRAEESGCRRLYARVRLSLCGRLGRAQRFEVEPPGDDNLGADVMQKGVRACVDAVREVDGAGHTEHLRGARSCEARITAGRADDAHSRAVRREGALYEVRDAAVFVRVRRLEV